MTQLKLDCTGCKNRPTLAEAEAGDAYCTKFSDMPQNGMCMQHSQFDSAKKVGDTYRANRAAGVPAHLSSPRPTEQRMTGPSGSYLHLPSTSASISL